MPKIQHISTLHITPEKFVAACSETELQELELELHAALRRKRLIDRGYINEIQVEDALVIEPKKPYQVMDEIKSKYK
jgi:hypothetical protein